VAAVVSQRLTPWGSTVFRTMFFEKLGRKKVKREDWGKTEDVSSLGAVKSQLTGG
jgi:hypothetical protein